MITDSSEAGALLEVQSLGASYGKVEALRDVSVRVGKGQIVTVIGPNGAGKTTLLNSIMGVLDNVTGRVSMGGTLLKGSVEDRVGRALSLVPESRELFSNMSVSDNLALGAYLRDRAGDKTWKQTLEEVFELFPRLRERDSQLAGTLSGGERQMLAIGRALMGKPSALMLDEPSLGLAPLVVLEIFSIIKKLSQRGAGILLVEQNARAALQCASYAYVLENGALVKEGPADTLLHDPQVISSYLGFGNKKTEH
jgi:branched-chain amino acid transport system ATP-binding protein